MKMMYWQFSYFTFISRQAWLAWPAQYFLDKMTKLKLSGLTQTWAGAIISSYQALFGGWTTDRVNIGMLDILAWFRLLLIRSQISAQLIVFSFSRPLLLWRFLWTFLLRSPLALSKTSVLYFYLWNSVCFTVKCLCHCRPDPINSVYNIRMLYKRTLVTINP